MSPRNLADPTYEPSDEDLSDLMQRAFASVPTQELERRSRAREEIARERRAVLTRLRGVRT